MKVCDFGHAGLYSGRFDMFSTGLVGSLYHLSPEQIGGAAYSGTKVDVWALGVALDRMLTSFPPFYSETPQEIVDLIMQIKWQHKGMVHPDTGVSLPIPPLVTALLETIFVDDPDKRPDADDLISSAWLTTKREDLDVPISQLPSLSNSRIPLAGWMSTRSAWTVLSSALRRLGVHHVHSKNSLHTIRCHYVAKDVRFLVTLVPRKEQSAAFCASARNSSSCGVIVVGVVAVVVVKGQQGLDGRRAEHPPPPAVVERRANLGADAFVVVVDAVVVFAVLDSAAIVPWWSRPKPHICFLFVHTFYY